jgi:PKD domain
VTFVVSVSDPGQKVERFRWNFGDGSALQDTSGDQVTYLYRQPGPKAIEVHADIGNGRRLAAGRVLEVLPAPK